MKRYYKNKDNEKKILLLIKVCFSKTAMKVSSFQDSHVAEYARAPELPFPKSESV